MGRLVRVNSFEDVIFHESIEKYGGIYSPDFDEYINEKAYFRSLLNEYSNSGILTKPFPKIYFGYVNNLTINALARSIDENSAIIGIYCGTKPLLSDLFNRMLSYKVILPEIGDSAGEIFVDPSIRNYYSNYIELKEYGDLNYNEYQPLVPKCETRKLYAIHLTNLAQHFIFQHELAHILNGHTLYSLNNFHADEILEVSLSQDEMPSITRNTLEMDADCSALNQCVAQQIFRFNDLTSVSQPLRQFYFSQEQAIMDIYLAVYCFFRLIDEAYQSKNAALTTKHPPPRVRQLYLITSLIENIKLKKHVTPISIDLLLARHKALFREVEMAYKIITGNPMNKEPFSRSNYSENPLAVEMLSHWKVIQPELKKYAYKPLVPI